MRDADQKFIIVLVAVGDEAEAAKIASALVDERLAACVKVYPVNSTYRWQGNVQRDREWQLVIKTQHLCYASIESRIRALHSYDVPEIIALPILQGYPPYLDWVAQETAEIKESEI